MISTYVKNQGEEYIKWDSMRKSRSSKAKQNQLIEHFVAGTTARVVADLVCVNRKTAVYYFKLIFA